MFLRETERERQAMVLIVMKINSCVEIRTYVSPLCHDSYSICKTHCSTLASRDT